MVQIQDISSSAIILQLGLLRVLTVGISLDYLVYLQVFIRCVYAVF